MLDHWRWVLCYLDKPGLQKQLPSKTSNIRRRPALLQLYFHFGLNTWLQWTGQRDNGLGTTRQETFKFLGFGVTYIRGLMVMFASHETHMIYFFKEQVLITRKTLQTPHHLFSYGRNVIYIALYSCYVSHVYVEFGEWKSNFIPHVIMRVINYPYCD